jgi:hypothetical protein
MAGGGVHGTGDGIVRIIITVVGDIIIMFLVFILMLIRVGEDTTERIIGTGIDGTTNVFLTSDLCRTGRAGRVTDIGRSREHGESRIINLDLNNRNRN